MIELGLLNFPSHLLKCNIAVWMKHNALPSWKLIIMLQQEIIQVFLKVTGNRGIAFRELLCDEFNIFEVCYCLGKLLP